MSDYAAPPPRVELSDEWVLACLREVMKDDYAATYPGSDFIHGARAIDVTCGQRYEGRYVSWFDAYPVLERLVESGQLVRVTCKTTRVPYYREVGQ